MQKRGVKEKTAGDKSVTLTWRVVKHSRVNSADQKMRGCLLNERNAIETVLFRVTGLKKKKNERNCPLPLVW